MLGNIRNHFVGMGGKDKVIIVLLVYGPAVRAFHTADASVDMTGRPGELTSLGLQLHACTNTTCAQGVTLKDLLPGFVVADKGGVARLAEGQGYVYLLP